LSLLLFIRGKVNDIAFFSGVHVFTPSQLWTADFCVVAEEKAYLIGLKDCNKEQWRSAD
jgi:hypothetical protein